MTTLIKIDGDYAEWIRNLSYLNSISRSHHRFIIDKCKKDTDKALFYVRKTIENNWSRNVLLNFLDTDLYERQGKAVSNFKSTLPSIEDIEKELGENDS